jgi:hypothetical protein
MMCGSCPNSLNGSKHMLLPRGDPVNINLYLHNHNLSMPILDLAYRLTINIHKTL